MKKITTKDFILKANHKHNQEYTYDNSIYTHSRDQIIVTCKIHGDFTCKANNHLNGSGCVKCRTNKVIKARSLDTIKFIDKANLLHKNKYNYTLVNYCNNKSFITIICPIHGKFNQNPSSHLMGVGCKKCGYEAVSLKNSGNFEDFLIKAFLVHKKLYSYPDTTYKNVKEKIIIECKKHGLFNQTIQSHLKGSGCPLCKIDLIGWTLSKWIEKSLVSKKFISYQTYIIKCWNKEEIFYKIGRTFNDIKQRFNSKNSMPYNYEIIKIYSGDAKEMYNLEIKLKADNKEYKYIPNIYFSGIQECFTKLNSHE